jgi:hypothetical protein
MASRRARTNARASVARARSEPVRGHGQVELGETVLVHTHRFIHAMLTVDAVCGPIHRAGPLPELDAFLAATAATLSAVEQAVRAGAAPRATPKLRPLQEELAAAVGADRHGDAGLDAATAAALLDATDRITNSLDTLLAELRRQLTWREWIRTTSSPS